MKSVLPPTGKPGRPSTQPGPASEDIDHLEFLQGLDLPSVDLDLRIEQLAGTDFDIRDVKLRGNVRTQLIDNAKLSMRLEIFSHLKK